MLRHQTIIANCFKAAGWVIGIPSLVSLLGLAPAWVDLYTRPAMPASAPADIRTGGLVALLENGAHGVGTAFDTMLGLGEWFIGVLALLALAATLLAAVLYFTGRGIARRSTWARIAGGLIAAGALLVSYGTLVSLPGDIAPFACLPLGASIYALWVLGWRYAEGGAVAP